MKHIGVKTIFKSDTDILSPKAYHKYGFELTKKYTLWKESRLLDVGCLVGNYLYLLQNSNAIGIDVLIDPIKSAAKKRLNNDFALSSVLNLSFQNSSFDSLTMWEVIEHVPSGTEKDAFKEVYRVLKNHGTLLLSTPNNNFFSIILDPAYFLWHHRHYDKKDLEKMLEEIGFVVVHSEIKAGFNELLGFLITAFFKYAFHRRFENLQQFLEKQSEKEYKKKGGFSRIFIVAKKINK